MHGKNPGCAVDAMVYSLLLVALAARRLALGTGKGMSIVGVLRRGSRPPGLAMVIGCGASSASPVCGSSTSGPAVTVMNKSYTHCLVRGA